MRKSTSITSIVLGAIVGFGAMAVISRNFKPEDKKEEEKQSTETVYTLAELEVGQDLTGYKIRLRGKGLEPFGDDSSVLVLKGEETVWIGQDGYSKFKFANQCENYEAPAGPSYEDLQWTALSAGLWTWFDDTFKANQNYTDKDVENYVKYLFESNPYSEIYNFMYGDMVLSGEVQEVQLGTKNINNIEFYKE